MSISLVQYGQYLQYMFASVLMLLIFGTVYLKITPVRELKLIKNGNLACALSFGGALVGFCLPLASSIAHSVSLPDFVLWGAAAAVGRDQGVRHLVDARPSLLTLRRQEPEAWAAARTRMSNEGSVRVVQGGTFCAQGDILCIE